MKRLIFSALLLSAVTANAQVGINIDNPKATLHVVGKNPAAQAEGIIFPLATQAEINSWSGLGNLEVGTVVYNTDQKCLESWTGTKWENHCGGRRSIVPGPPPPPVIPGPILPAPAPAPTLPSLPGGLTLGDSGYYLASIYDEDYLPYNDSTQPAGNGQFGAHPADGNDYTTVSNPYPAENTIINVQGKLDHTGIEVGIPIRDFSGTTVTIPEFSVYSKVKAEHTQDGQERDVELHFPSQTFTYGGDLGQRRWIKAVLRTKDPAETLYVKKLDMNIGNGSNYRGVPLAEFKYFSDDSKANVKTFYFNAVTGIPDLNFSTPQGASSGSYAGQYLHRFIYVPAYGQDGNVWLSNNLGASYANLDDYANFDPNKRAESHADYKAFGSLFQRGRDVSKDAGMLGHELMNWTNATTGTPKISQLSWTQDLSAGMTSVIEYCPSGFVTPIWWQWGDYINAASNVTNREGKDEMRQDPFLRLTTAGYRTKDNGNTVFDISQTGILEHGVYWANNTGGVKSFFMNFYRGNPTPTPPATPISPLIKSTIDIASPVENSYGFPIRCIKQ